nr:pentatricopeptide repeat protein AaPPR253 [Agave angustifolia]
MFGMGFHWMPFFAYKKMVGRGCEVDKFTYPSVLKACSMILDLDLGRVIHGIIEISGLQHDLFIRNALVSMYANCGLMSVARKLFDVMSEKDIVTWNSLISGYSSKGMVEESFELLEKLQLEESKMNTVTLNTIAATNSQMDKHLEALKLIAKMRNNDSSIDSASLVIGLNSCSRIGHLRLGLAVGTQEEEIFEIFHDMIRSQVQPNYVTLMTVVSICARTNNLRYGQELHCYITKHGFNDYQLLCNSLIDMYSKSGRISVARRVFDMMTDYDRVSYTSMIAGYGMQGEGMKALDLFDKMICCGIKPDGITMVVVLSACGHSGLITHGEMLFEKMFVIYGIFPQMEHYSCMVDLFVRAGFLRNAEEFINHMPFEPSTAMLATLIRACQTLGNREIGERAAKRLLEMRSDDPNHYLLIANMFTYCGKWEELAGVRTIMKDKGIIELYILLAGLFENMRDVEYVGNQDFGV